MTKPARTNFLAGVIEGFYGPPWAQEERLQLFAWMRRWRLNTYLYAPKDDLKHRALWRRPYSAAESAILSQVIQACARNQVRFIYGLSPGLDIRYGHRPDVERLKQRLDQMVRLGCRDFALLFDDIPDRLDPGALRRWGSLAAAQSGIVNEVFRWLTQKQPRALMLFCPTPYCGRMAMRELGGKGYLETVGRELLPEVEVFWTGPEIISREVTVPHVRDLRKALRRPPLIWDNLHANDYDGRRFFCGPYSGRSRQLRLEVRGFLLNPNTEFPLNYVPLRTFADFVQGAGPWRPRHSYQRAMAEWLASFKTVSRSFTPADLVAFGDCYYLPHEHGAEANRLIRQAANLLARDPKNWGSAARALEKRLSGLVGICARMADLRDRKLFHALHRRAWELREELALLEHYIRSRRENATAPTSSDFHLPLTYRGGVVAGLQRLLVQNADGTFSPAQREPHAGPK